MDKEIYAEGNNGGDNIHITVLEDGNLRVKIGHCCVYYIDAIMPVPVLTLIIANGLTHLSIKETIQNSNWPQKFKDELCAQVQDSHEKLYNI